jgi:hypothetical protein
LTSIALSAQKSSQLWLKSPSHAKLELPPVPIQDAEKFKAVLTTFLIYNLTEANYDFLLACKVWSSIAIMFYITLLDPPCPNFIFTIKGFTKFVNENI